MSPLAECPEAAQRLVARSRARLFLVSTEAMTSEESKVVAAAGDGLEWQLVDWHTDDGWVYRLDADVYPCDSPCTPGLMASLFTKMPRLAFKLVGTAEAVGPQGADAASAKVPEGVAAVAVFLALTPEAWQGLVEGNLVEGELTAEQLFDPRSHPAVGIHCYHLHRFSAAASRFSQRALSRLSQELGGLSVVGFSGLCVTSAGQRLFGSLGCSERAAFRSQEHVIRPHLGAPLSVIYLDPALPTHEYEQSILSHVDPSRGGSWIRCQMLVWTPDSQQSSISRFFLSSSSSSSS
ncbi:MAG: hypothetical protein Q8P67_18430 [archaeon]|nr:hypothetical protein [archaeon]